MSNTAIGPALEGDGPVVVHEQDCPLERWDDPGRGGVTWRTLLSGDRTPTRDLTMGVAEIPPGESSDPGEHRHAQVEVYYILSGEGSVVIDGVSHPVRAGSAVYVPGDARHGVANTGVEVLRLLYVFAVDAFDQVEYRFEAGQSARENREPGP